MEESYQREEYCSDHRKGSLRHFQPPKNLGSTREARPIVTTQSVYRLVDESNSAQSPVNEPHRDVTPTAYLSAMPRRSGLRALSFCPQSAVAMGSGAWLSGGEFAFFSACGTAGRTADSEYLFRGHLGHK